ncbi:putative quinol monooxygenase [Oceanimonas smirnovii]|uniref:putative quinol monooxygenase n=1 Tax=Oceanimonas smirnovii TaxID=264574 RepID=UPI00376FFDA8
MSSRVYCIAAFKPKPGKEQELFRVLQALESDTLREDGCIQYRVTRHVDSPFAGGHSFPLVFNEIWADMASFEAHCVSPDGLVTEHNVCIYTDEPEDFDAPRF